MRGFHGLSGIGKVLSVGGKALNGELAAEAILKLFGGIKVFDEDENVNKQIATIRQDVGYVVDSFKAMVSEAKTIASKQSNPYLEQINAYARNSSNVYPSSATSNTVVTTNANAFAEVRNEDARNALMSSDKRKERSLERIANSTENLSAYMKDKFGDAYSSPKPLATTSDGTTLALQAKPNGGTLDYDKIFRLDEEAANNQSTASMGVGGGALMSMMGLYMGYKMLKGKKVPTAAAASSPSSMAAMNRLARMKIGAAARNIGASARSAGSDVKAYLSWGRNNARYDSLKNAFRTSKYLDNGYLTSSRVMANGQVDKTFMALDKSSSVVRGRRILGKIGKFGARTRSWYGSWICSEIGLETIQKETMTRIVGVAQLAV